MPNTRSSAKQARKSRKRYARNRAAKDELRKVVRVLKEAIGAKDQEKARAVWPEFVSVVDRLVKRGHLHRNAAARRKSRMARVLQGLGAVL
ncbi:30S ribosomal protein S20 [Candidatus Methylacidithermus pantelleriae]|uniref:Small ribosomal subunit protein bS20 n=1 Tax=Candidatus Methylacidithermus pantelleriae TaxID=2744239 RepID=A0A8J2BK75_9BACT|nr:30S ribosomal protein S20 [Candidatus Methylacidithermus pantelleriae]CAF0695442.1 30S ribosomal protein S20 [Candidatus Methylacidithermus pantelleriae]